MGENASGSPETRAITWTASTTIRPVSPDANGALRRSYYRQSSRPIQPTDRLAQGKTVEHLPQVRHVRFHLPGPLAAQDALLKPHHHKDNPGTSSVHSPNRSSNRASHEQDAREHLPKSLPGTGAPSVPRRITPRRWSMDKPQICSNPPSTPLDPSDSVTSIKSMQERQSNPDSLLDATEELHFWRERIDRNKSCRHQLEVVQKLISKVSRGQAPCHASSERLLTLGKEVLEDLANRRYGPAFYLLADGYASGLWGDRKPAKALELFVAASKNGHAEACFRAGLAFEFGWGASSNLRSAEQFYRTSATKLHPGAATRLGLACLRSELGLSGQHRCREGLRWLRCAEQHADERYNSGPYELARLYRSGFGDHIFKDERYAAELLTKSARLSHVEANFQIGRAYEKGLLGCHRDLGTSIRFYKTAAEGGHDGARSALEALRKRHRGAAAVHRR